MPAKDWWAFFFLVRKLAPLWCWSIRVATSYQPTQLISFRIVKGVMPAQTFGERLFYSIIKSIDVEQVIHIQQKRMAADVGRPWIERGP